MIHGSHFSKVHIFHENQRTMAHILPTSVKAYIHNVFLRKI
jgi:hypothetical protein